MKVLLLVFILALTGACQQKPTRTIEESTQVYDRKAVLIDTRNPFLYDSFHIEGSENLWSEDFLILTNPKKKTRMLDPDLNQTVQRLASKGIHPNKTVILLNDKPDAIENKKWKWLLSYLEIKSIQTRSLDDFKKSTKGQNNRFAKPEPQQPWKLLTSEDFQKDLVLKKAPKCFVKWEAQNCL